VNDWITAFNDPNFFRGALVMGVLMFILMFYAAYMRAQSLYLTAKNGGREKLGDKFYYIVEESEYHALTFPHLPKFGEDEGEVSVVVETSVPFLMYVVRATWREYYCGRISGGDCKSPDIKQAKFYWSKEEAERDQEAFRLLYPLDASRMVFIIQLDELVLDEVAYEALLVIARNQLLPPFNLENKA
jgi:hypothetical protein